MQCRLVGHQRLTISLRQGELNEMKKLILQKRKFLEGGVELLSNYIKEEKFEAVFVYSTGSLLYHKVEKVFVKQLVFF